MKTLGGIKEKATRCYRWCLEIFAKAKNKTEKASRYQNIGKQPGKVWGRFSPVPQQSHGCQSQNRQVMNLRNESVKISSSICLGSATKGTGEGGKGDRKRRDPVVEAQEPLCG